MGAIWFDKHDFADHLHEVVGYKSGIAASMEHMCDLLSGTGFDDEIVSSEERGIRIRSEDYDTLYNTLLHKIGVTDRPLDGIFEIFKISREMEHRNGAGFARSIQDIYRRHIKIETKKALQEGRKSLDPEGMIREAVQVHGKAGLGAIMTLIQGYDDLMKHSPHTAMKFHQYTEIVNLADLFERYNSVPEKGVFLDQRFIDFLSYNLQKLGEIHWRKFEELTAECFQRFGYIVDLGPGSNDDGVDLRVWNNKKEGTPEFIIQCISNLSRGSCFRDN